MLPGDPGARADLARALWLVLDTTRLDALASEIARDGDRDALEASLVPLLLRVARGDSAAALADARTLEARGMRESSPRVVIEAAALAGHAALDAGDADLARSLARRASRMARTEALPEAEYFAHLELARIRRHDGRPHLALRILGAIARAAPARWHPWIAWETTMAGAGETAAALVDALPTELSDVPATQAARCLLALVRAASHGDRDAHDGAREAALAIAGDVAFVRRDLEEACVVLDSARSPSRVAADVARFVEGTEPLPVRLSGLAGIAPTGSGPAGGWVLARPDAPPRRVLAAGLGLAGSAYERRHGDGQQLRTERAAATLLLAGPDGIAREELFRRVYGFAFKQVTHQGVLDVLVHRVRSLLGESAKLDRSAQTIAAVARVPLAVPEGASAQPLEDRVLRALAERGGLGAREAAEAIGIPLRTVQAALARLVEEGACLTERRGRAVAYRVEDTTFSEPTRPDAV